MPDAPSSRAAVEQALEQLRPGFNADGADLQLTAYSGDAAEVTLVVGADTCQECVVAGPMLATIVESAVRHMAPHVETVTVVDPR